MKKIIVILLSFLLLSGLGFWFFMNQIKQQVKVALYGQFSSDRLPGVQFTTVDLGEDAQGKFTTLVFGPDEKLYAATGQGQIRRYAVKEDGMLALEAEFKPFGETEKLLIGLTFDPKSTADHLSAWITFSHHADVKNGPAWDGNLSRLEFDPHSNRLLEYTPVLTHLPRSSLDHLTFSMAFGPDGAMYFNQGSNTSMGRATDEEEWEDRQESLLSGAVLRLDTEKLPKKLPLSVKTVDGGGDYNPYAPDAPLTLYATGMRNAYDLVWHSNGELYVPVNGSMGNKNTPTSNPEDPAYIPHSSLIKYDGPTNVPALTKSGQPQNDWLFRVKPGAYYGHPNPIRAEYVLNRGEVDVDDPVYVGVNPPENYDHPAYDFGKHASPNGIIEYKSNTFASKLKGQLMVARFNVYQDIMVLEIDEKTKEVVRAYDGKYLGLGDLSQPLDLIENVKTGDIYVSEFGGDGKITLLRPVVDAQEYEKLMEEKHRARLARAQKQSAININNVKVRTDDTTLQRGSSIFAKNCAVCHGKSGEGLSGPNLTDAYWIYGGDIKSIFKVVLHGAGNGMQAWDEKLDREEIQDVASYILSLQGTNPPEAKSPEGEVFVPVNN